MGRFVPNDLAVDSAGNAVLQLQVHLGDGVLGEDGSLGDITCKLDNWLDSARLIRILCRMLICGHKDSSKDQLFHDFGRSLT